MIRIMIAIVSLAGLLLPAGCRRESNPPPRFIARGNGRAIPVRVYGRVLDAATGPMRGKSIIAAAPADDQPAENPPADKNNKTTTATEKTAPRKPAAEPVATDQTAQVTQEQTGQNNAQEATGNEDAKTEQETPSESASAVEPTPSETTEAPTETENSAQGSTTLASNDPNYARNWKVYRGLEALYEELETVRDKAQEKEPGATAERGGAHLEKDFAVRLRGLRRQVAKPEPDTAAFHLDVAGGQIYIMAGNLRKPDTYQEAQQKYQQAMEQARALMGEPPPEQEEQPVEQQPAEPPPANAPRANTSDERETTARKSMDRPGPPKPGNSPPPSTSRRPRTPPPPPGAQPRHREEVDEVFDGPGMLRNRGS